MEKSAINLSSKDASSRVWTIDELQQENALLFEQLHVLQEELELRAAAPAAKQAGAPVTVLQFVDEHTPEVIAENLRYRAALDARQEMRRLESQQALADRLGSILLEGSESLSSMFGIPGRLMNVWRKERKKLPPKEYGGKSFDKVLAAYKEGGLRAVEQLLASATTSSAIQANAWTALARSLMHSDPAGAVEFARRACALEPQSFRFKWLAFRLYEAGSVVESEALLDALPEHTSFSDSEERLASRLRHEAKAARLHEARKKLNYVERRRQIEERFKTLDQCVREQAELIAECGRTIEGLKRTQAELEVERNSVIARHAEKSALAADRGSMVDALEKEIARLRSECAEWRRRDAEHTEQCVRYQELTESLRRTQVALEDRNASLHEQYSEQMELAAARGRIIDELRAQAIRLEAERDISVESLRTGWSLQQESHHAGEREKEADLELTSAREHVARLLRARAIQRQAEQDSLLTDLTQKLSSLEKEYAALLQRQAAQSTLIAAREQDIDALRSSAARHEADRSALLEAHAGRVFDLSQLVRKLEARAVELEEENSSLRLQFAEREESIREYERAIDLLRGNLLRQDEVRQVLQAQNEEHKLSIQERDRLIEQIHSVQVSMEQELATMRIRDVEQGRLIVERDKLLETYKAAEVQWERDKAGLIEQTSEQMALAEERSRRVGVLEEQLELRQAMSSELSNRQQGMHEELVRAEAQIDFIKDMLLRGPRP